MWCVRSEYEKGKERREKMNGKANEAWSSMSFFEFPSILFFFCFVFLAHKIIKLSVPNTRLKLLFFFFCFFLFLLSKSKNNKLSQVWLLAFKYLLWNFQIYINFFFRSPCYSIATTVWHNKTSIWKINGICIHSNWRNH